MGRRGGKNKQKKAIEQKDPQEVRNEQKKKNKNSANQEEDPQEVRNEQKKNNSIPENDPQEDVNDETTAKNKFRKGKKNNAKPDIWKSAWHQKLQKLPPGQVIDIPYLKTLEKTHLSQLPIVQKLSLTHMPVQSSTVLKHPTLSQDILPVLMGVIGKCLMFKSLV